jgi:hypothetical protein
VARPAGLPRHAPPGAGEARPLVVHHSASTFETEARSLEQEAYAEFAIARDDLGPAHGWCVDDLLCVTSSGHHGWVTLKVSQASTIWLKGLPRLTASLAHTKI